MSGKRTPTGLRARHSRPCLRASGGTGEPCSCTGGPSWQAIVFDKRTGVRISKTFSGRGAYSAAKQWRADAVHAQGRGRLRPQTKRTVAEAAVELIRGMEDGSIRSKRRQRYAPSTVRSYRRHLGLEPEQRERAPERLIDALGHYKLGELDRHTVQAFANQQIAAGWDASTVNNLLDPLRVIYRIARDRDEVTVDPTELLGLPTPQGRRERIAGPEEAAKLLAALPEAERPLWATFMYGGLRRGEARALTWADVDLGARQIAVRASWDDVQGRGPTKTPAGERTVPILDPLAPLLRAHRLATGRRGDDLVFGRTADQPFDPTAIRRRAREAWRRAGLEPLTPHQGRHTFVSLLAAARVPESDAMRYVGHRDAHTTRNIYTHAQPDADERARELVAAYMGRYEAAGPALRPV